MNKEQYIIQQLKKKYPDLVKEEETSYILEQIDNINRQRHFEDFIEKLKKL